MFKYYCAGSTALHNDYQKRYQWFLVCHYDCLIQMSWKELENESTDHLIEYIRWYSDPELKDSAEDAFRAFCFRFQLDLAKKM